MPQAWPDLPMIFSGDKETAKRYKNPEGMRRPSENGATRGIVSDIMEQQRLSVVNFRPLSLALARSVGG